MKQLTNLPKQHAAALMRGRSVGSLVVTSANGKVAGIVTVADLLEQLAKKPEHKSNREKRRAATRDQPWDD